MLNSFKPSEFLHVLRKIERLLGEAVIELRAIREGLERPAIYTSLKEDVDCFTLTCGCSCEKDDE